jgi:hypothetical protein
LQESAKSQILFELPFCRKTLGKILGFAMWPLGAASRRGLPEFGELTGVLGRERTGGGSRVTRDSVWGVGQGGAAPASGSPAAREGWPLRLPSTGEGRLGKRGSEPASLCRCQGSYWGCRPARGAGGGAAHRGGRWRLWAVRRTGRWRCVGRGDGPIYATRTRQLGTSGPKGEGAMVGVWPDDGGLLGSPKRGRPARVRARHVAGRGVPGVSGWERRWERAREVLGKARAGTVVETTEGRRGAAPARDGAAWRAVACLISN